MLEKDIVAAIMRYLKSAPHVVRVSFCWKQHGGQFGVAGLPDIICCIGGQFVAFEVKTAKGRLTKLQETTIARINAAGGKAYVVRSVAEVREIIENMGGVENG